MEFKQISKNDLIGLEIATNKYLSVVKVYYHINLCDIPVPTGSGKIGVYSFQDNTGELIENNNIYYLLNRGLTKIGLSTGFLYCVKVHKVEVNTGFYQECLYYPIFGINEVDYILTKIIDNKFLFVSVDQYIDYLRSEVKAPNKVSCGIEEMPKCGIKLIG